MNFPSQKQIERYVFEPGDPGGVLVDVLVVEVEVEVVEADEAGQ